MFQRVQPNGLTCQGIQTHLLGHPRCAEHYFVEQGNTAAHQSRIAPCKCGECRKISPTRPTRKWNNPAGQRPTFAGCNVSKRPNILRHFAGAGKLSAITCNSAISSASAESLNGNIWNIFLLSKPGIFTEWATIVALKGRLTEQNILPFRAKNYSIFGVFLGEKCE